MSRYIGDGHPSSVARSQPVVLIHGANDAVVPLQVSSLDGR
jgi:predicted esterase